METQIIENKPERDAILRANASLIAAAPDMLKALFDMRCAFGHPDDDEVNSWWEARAEDAAENGRDSAFYRAEALAAARAALAKADGVS